MNRKTQDPHRVLNKDATGSVCTPETAALIRRAGADGAVLLKNENNVLPLKKGGTVAVFGRCQRDWFFVGYGSGGNVLAEHRTDLIEGLEAAGVTLDAPLKDRYTHWCRQNAPKEYAWGEWPFSLPEMPVTDGDILKAAERAETAILVIGRNAGEDRDMKYEPGSYRLTEDESDLLFSITRAFRKTAVVLNTSNLIDLSDPGFRSAGALLVCWQGGQESGHSAADILTGRVCPSGKLAATWAQHFAYPGTDEFEHKTDAHYSEGVRIGYRFINCMPQYIFYPFGYGLSYTSFAFLQPLFRHVGGKALFSVTVQNTGACAGRETVQLYAVPPKDAPGTEEMPVLIGYKKTKLLAPDESETLTVTAEDRLFAAFDEEKHAFVLREGEYRFVWGTDSLHTEEAGRIRQDRQITVKQCAPLPDGTDYVKPEPYKKPDRPVHMDDVKAGTATVEELIATLSDEELEYLSRGEGNMESALGVSGNAGIMGGVCASLREKGIRPIVTSDGPAGLRLNVHASLFPNGTLLACTFDDALVEELFGCFGREAKAIGADIVLGPGMNLQRNPCNGRNFEYFSEDPVLSGRIAAAAVRGIQSAGVAACPKHFCCNNKESGRKSMSSEADERTLRELYLKNFEICLEEGKPLTLMTSYNRINGVFACYHYPLVTGVVRKEWGFDGLIMTDWWMAYVRSAYFAELENNPARIRAGVNVLMPGHRDRFDRTPHNDEETLAALRNGTLGRGELERNARYVLGLQLKLDARK